jgi:hypothetical protein
VLPNRKSSFNDHVTDRVVCDHKHPDGRSRGHESGRLRSQAPRRPQSRHESGRLRSQAPRRRRWLLAVGHRHAGPNRRSLPPPDQRPDPPRLSCSASARSNCSESAGAHPSLRDLSHRAVGAAHWLYRGTEGRLLLVVLPHATANLRSRFSSRRSAVKRLSCRTPDFTLLMIITAADVVATNGAAHLSRTHPKAGLRTRRDRPL